MATITDRQVRLLWRLLDEEHSLTHAALKCGMDRKTARRYIHRNRRQFAVGAKALSRTLPLSAASPGRGEETPPQRILLHL